MAQYMPTSNIEMLQINGVGAKILCFLTALILFLPFLKLLYRTIPSGITQCHFTFTVFFHFIDGSFAQGYRYITTYLKNTEIIATTASK